MDPRHLWIRVGQCRTQCKVDRCHRSVTFAGGHNSFRSNVDFHGGFRHDLAFPVLNEHAIRLEAEERLCPTLSLANEKLKRRVCRLEVISLVFEILDSVNNELRFVRGELEARILRLREDCGPTGEFGDDRPRRIPNRRRGEMLVRVWPACQRRRVEAGLVGECRDADIWQVIVESEVDDLRDVVRDAGEVGEPILGNGLVPHLDRDVRDDRTEVSVPGPFTVSVDTPLDLRDAGRRRGETICDRGPRIVVKVAPERRIGECGGDLSDNAFHIMWQRAAVCIAEDETLSPAVAGGPERGECELGIRPIAVEEMLGIEEDATVD